MNKPLFIAGSHVDYLAYELAMKRKGESMLSDEKTVTEVNDLFDLADLISKAKVCLRSAESTVEKQKVMRELTVLHEELFLTVERLRVDNE